MKVRNLSEDSLHLCLEKDTVIVVKQGEVVDMPKWVYKMLQSTARLEIVEEKKVEEPVVETHVEVKTKKSKKK